MTCLENDPIVDIAASSLRVAVLTKSSKIATWLTNCGVGERACKATEVRFTVFSMLSTLFQIKATQLPFGPEEHAVELAVSNHLAIVRSSSQAFSWW